MHTQKLGQASIFQAGPAATSAQLVEILFE